VQPRNRIRHSRQQSTIVGPSVISPFGTIRRTIKLRSRSRTFVDLLHRDYTVLRWADEKLGFRRLSVHPGFVARVLPLRTRRSLSPLSEGVPGEGDEKLGLHRLSVHPGFVARVSPPRTRRSLSPPFGGGARGGVGSRLGNRVGPLGPCKIRLRTVSKHTANCPAHPPWPPLRKGGKGIGRSHRLRSRAT